MDTYSSEFTGSLSDKRPEDTIDSSATEVTGDVGVEATLPLKEMDAAFRDEEELRQDDRLDIFDDTYSDADMEEEDASFASRWNCPPYKRCMMQDEVDEVMMMKDGHGDRKAQKQIVEKLHELGVQVFVLRHDSADIFDEIERIIAYISKYDRSVRPHESERCLLFRDRKGRLFNLTFKGESEGLAATWSSVFMRFSGLQAMIALTVLTRAFACFGNGGQTNIGPGFLSIILGVVLSEEISHVFANTSMLVQGTPSISAYTLLARFLSDWPRKLIVLSLAMASVAEAGSDTQHYMTISGIGLAFIVLAANLGSRAWYNLRWNAVKYEGFFGSVYGFVAATLTGLAIPYFGYNQTAAGGKAALETILSSSLLVALIFIASDLNVVQRLIIVNSEICDQAVVNMAVGAWWSVSLIVCLNIARKLEPFILPSEENELLLVKDQASPVGTKVPNLPDFAIDPSSAKQGSRKCNLKLEFLIGVTMAIVVGAGIVFSSFMDYADNVPEFLSGVRDLFK